MSASHPIRRKLVIVGDGACGKTSLLCSFALGEFPSEYHPTVFENYVAEIILDGRPVQLALWDTAGQEAYERLRPLSYANAHVVLIAFALDAPDSLAHAATNWAAEVRLACRGVPVLLIGCKSDRRTSAPSACVTRAAAERAARVMGVVAYIECSALLGAGVEDVFEAATRASLQEPVAAARPSRTGCCIVC